MDEDFLHESTFENDLVYSQNVIEFVTIAGEFCGFTENATNFSRKEFMEKSLKLLPLLYLKSMLLPKIDSMSDIVNEKFVAEHDWIFIKDTLAERLGSYDSFIEVADLTVQTTFDDTNLSISECFADIYQELKDFISLYQLGDTESMNDGLWECKLNFEQTWGQKILGVLANFHQVYFGVEEIEEKDELNSGVNQETPKNAWVDTFFEKKETNSDMSF